IKLTRVDTAATAEDQPAAIRRDRRVGVACRWERRVGQLPFLSAFYRNYEQGVRLAVARGICNNQTVALRTPGEAWRRGGVPRRSRGSPSVCAPARSVAGLAVIHCPLLIGGARRRSSVRRATTLGYSRCSGRWSAAKESRRRSVARKCQDYPAWALS